MKRIIIFSLFFLICGASHAEWETYVVEKPDGSLAIHNYNLNAKDSLNDTLEDAGLGGLSFHKVTGADLPETKEDREHWRKAGRQVVVDQGLKQQAKQANQQAEQSRQAVLAKLGITEKEMESLAPIVKGKK